MNGPYSYHSHSKYKATHLTRECTLNDWLTKEKATKLDANAESDDDENLSPPTRGAGNADRGAAGSGGAPKAFP